VYVVLLAGGVEMSLSFVGAAIVVGAAAATVAGVSTLRVPAFAVLGVGGLAVAAGLWARSRRAS
jgi:predicted ABC-type sugar transport system permease subunit